jgi:hypothetical protein
MRFALDRILDVAAMSAGFLAASVVSIGVVVVLIVVLWLSALAIPLWMEDET